MRYVSGRQCAQVNRCGDGSRDVGEECDDGGVIDADGCSAKCSVEPFFWCFGGTLTRADR